MKKIIYCIILVICLFGCTTSNVYKNVPEYLVKFEGCYGFVVSAELIVTAAHCTNIKRATTTHNQIVQVSLVYSDLYNDISIYKSDRTILVQQFATFYQGNKKLGNYYGGCGLYIGTVGRAGMYVNQEFDVLRKDNIVVRRTLLYSLLDIYSNSYPVFCSGDSGGIFTIDNQVVAMGSLIPDNDDTKYVEHISIYVVPAKLIEKAINNYQTGWIGI